MARLFFSLYLVIALSLIVLAASLDNLFDAPPIQPSPAMQAMAKLFRQMYPQGNMEKIAKEASIGLRWRDMSNFAWPNNAMQTLQAGEPVILHNQQNQQQMYLRMRDGRLLELTFPPEPDTSTSYLLYSSVFFLLLSIPLALWIWPLWQDLNAVKGATQSLQADGSLAEVHLKRHSPLKSIADAIKRLSSQIQQLLQSNRELTGAVAHEFRTPLARLKFALALKPAVGSEPWEAMNDDVNELEHLVQEMLDYASLESNAPDMDISQVPVKQLCQQTIDKIAYQHKLNITLEGRDYPIMADGYYVQRALQNLLQNALRYARTQVQISIVQDQRWVYIMVDDDGPGVANELRERIFDPFYRPDSGRDRTRGGAGLGLSIVRRIQQWHDGRCWVDPSPMGGARFVLCYPALEASQT